MNELELRKLLKEKPIPDFVQEYLFQGIPFCFKDDPELYYVFRRAICDKFAIHLQNFAVVGSAKVGFRMAPEGFGKPFSDTSDIDVVLVSEELFQELWIQLIEFRRKALFRLEKRYRRKFYELQTILFYGSIRLDMVTNDFPFAQLWWKFFNSLSTDERFGPRRIRAMIFKSWKHVSFYYEDSIRKVLD